MTNIGGPREAKRRRVASVVHSKLLYAAPVWANALQNHAIQRKLFSAQRLVALKIVSAYRTVSTSAVLILASAPTIHLLAEEKQETFQLRKELTCTDLQEIAREKEARMEGAGSLRNGRWDGMVSRPEDGPTAWFRSSPPGWTESHGCFKAYLRRFKKRDDEMCCYCDFPLDNAEHALFVCAKLGVAMEALLQAVGAELNPDMMVSLMLQSKRN